MAIDRFEDVLQALRDHPEWLAELRALVFTEELLSLPSLVAEQGWVLDSHTKTSADHTTTLAEHGTRLLSIEEAITRLEIRLDDALGTLTEERYRNKAYGHFGAIARRIKQLHGPALDDVLEPLEAAGELDDDERMQLLAADGIFDGRRGGAPIRLVMEASLVVDTDDVKRARDRARILARSGVKAVGVVAGKAVTPPAREAARAAEVWVVTDGRSEAPTTHSPREA